MGNLSTLKITKFGLQLQQYYSKIIAHSAR